MSRKVIPFPIERPRQDLPGYIEARHLVERMGPALAMRVAEYLCIEAVMATKTPARYLGRVRPAPWILAKTGIDLMMLVRGLAELYELRDSDRKAFNRADREYQARLKAETKAARAGRKGP